MSRWWNVRGLLFLGVRYQLRITSTIYLQTHDIPMARKRRCYSISYYTNVRNGSAAFRNLYRSSLLLKNDLVRVSNLDSTGQYIHFSIFARILVHSRYSSRYQLSPQLPRHQTLLVTISQQIQGTSPNLANPLNLHHTHLHVNSVSVPLLIHKCINALSLPMPNHFQFLQSWSIFRSRWNHLYFSGCPCKMSDPSFIQPSRTIGYSSIQRPKSSGNDQIYDCGLDSAFYFVALT